MTYHTIECNIGSFYLKWPHWLEDRMELKAEDSKFVYSISEGASYLEQATLQNNKAICVYNGIWQILFQCFTV